MVKLVPLARLATLLANANPPVCWTSLGEPSAAVAPAPAITLAAQVAAIEAQIVTNIATGADTTVFSALLQTIANAIQTSNPTLYASITAFLANP
jgi:hypothetical protein